jgi:hypothetical protein
MLETTKEERAVWLRQGRMPQANRVSALCRDVDALEAALRGFLPLHQDGGCWYCSLGNKPDADGIHFDRDNLWDGNQRCLESEEYAEARALLG